MNRTSNIIGSRQKNISKDSWKVVGLEQEGKFTVVYSDVNTSFYSFYQKTNSVQLVYQWDCKINVIQATIDQNDSVLIFVIKDAVHNGNVRYQYRLKAVNLIDGSAIADLDATSSKQIMSQFLYRKKQTNTDRLLVFTHKTSISMYELTHIEDQGLVIKLQEVIVDLFSWAQWNSQHQCLFYICRRKSSDYMSDECDGEKSKSESNMSMLTALQFHDDLPHETVLNIPLNLSETKSEVHSSASNLYNDLPIPLRVHDCSLNILVLMQPSGVFYICQYYFFQPTDYVGNYTSDQTLLHFTYSITVLHHGCIIQCTIPNISWNKATSMNPVFCMLEDQHLLVYVSDLYMHVLDLGASHEACCHFVTSSPLNKSHSRLISIPTTTSELLDLNKLDIFKVSVTEQQLMNSFNSDESSVNNKLAILHYILVHLCNAELLKEILLTLKENVTDLSTVKILKETLIGLCYASVSRHLSIDGETFMKLLPLTSTCYNRVTNEQINGYSLTLEQEIIFSPTVMLLTPRQRLIPFRTDVWTRLWNLLSNRLETGCETSRFKSSTVVEKLSVSLVCYQPEALSRCCTPLSPGAPHIASMGMLADLANISRSNKSGLDPLPFVEVETSAASKQEHVISVNLRELSLHLVKHGKSPMQVHAVAMRYVSSQLEVSRMLCSYVTQCCGIDTKHSDRGFSLINELPKDHKRLFFALLERYYLAVDSLAMPLPQGFPSFFAYLGYRVLPTRRFIDHVRANLFQVNIDVLKAVMIDKMDNGDDLKDKLNLLLQLPRSRVKRILNQWQHPISLMVRAREHSGNILSGASGVPSRMTMPKGIRHGAGLTAFPSNERLSPLDTFLDLLTAKANLAEIDFNLLMEATILSTDNFMNFN